MKRQNIIALLLSILLLPGLTACGMLKNAAGDAKENEAALDAGEIISAESPQEPAAELYVWDGITFTLTEVTEDLGEYKSQLKAPKGKYALVVFTITDGQIEMDRLEELILTEQNISLGGHAPATISAQGIAIKNDLVYVTGTINVFFDVPTELDTDNADVFVNEDISAP